MTRSAGERISVIVPALDESACICRCLASVRSQADAADELIVVDGGSSDDTAALSAPFGTVVRAPRGRAVQMNAGARDASGDLLLFLHADSMLHPGALGALRATMRDSRTAGGTFTLRFDEEHAVLRFYAACTNLPGPLLHYGDQGIFVRRDVFDRLGGFRELPLMEDVDFLRRLRAHGRVALIRNHPVTTSARRFAHHGAIRQQLRNAALLAAFYCGVAPARLARWYDDARP